MVYRLRTSKDILQELDKVFRTWEDKGYLRYDYRGENNDVLTPQVKTPGEYKQIRVRGNSDLEKKFIAVVDELEKRKQNKTIMVLARYNIQLQKVKQWCESAGKACVIHERGGFFKGAAVKEFCSLTEALFYHSQPMYLFNLLRSSYCYKPIDTDRLKRLEGSSKDVETYFEELINEELDWDKLIDDLRNRPVMAVLCEIINKTRPSIKYGAIQKHKYRMEGYDEEEGSKQAILDAKQYEADLQKLFQMLSDSFSDEFSSLYDICSYVRTRIDTDTDEDSADVRGISDMNCVQGLTVHAAKGLEFDYVLIPFMNYSFGKNNKSEILIDKESKKVGWQYRKNSNNHGHHNQYYELLKPYEKEKIIGDETRLLYVAMTRAIEGLYCFTWWKRNPGTVETWSDLLPEENDYESNL